MKSRRTAKVSEAIRQVVSSAILIELRDPRVKNVTVLHVEVSADLRNAKVFVSVLGDEKAERLSMQGLEASRGWLQSKIADQLQLRLTPILTFISDQGVKKSVEVSKMLREIQGDPLSLENHDERQRDTNEDATHLTEHHLEQTDEETQN